MEMFLDITSPYFWFSASFFLFILELLTAGSFFSMILAIAALITGIFSFFIPLFGMLFGIFAVLSLSGIFFMKPILEKAFHKTPTRPSNTDAIIGKIGIVKTHIHSAKKGLVKIETEDWTASSVTGEEIETGETIIVRKIEGVTLYVETLQSEQKGGE